MQSHWHVYTHYDEHNNFKLHTTIHRLLYEDPVILHAASLSFRSAVRHHETSLHHTSPWNPKYLPRGNASVAGEIKSVWLD